MLYTPRQKKSRKPNRWLHIFTVSLDRMKRLHREFTLKRSLRSPPTSIHNVCCTKTRSYYMNMLKVIQLQVTWFWTGSFYEKQDFVPAFSPFDAQFGGQVCSVSICDVRVFPQKPWNLFIGVQSDPSRHQHRPVLITSQLNVVCSLGALLGFLWHGWTRRARLSLT